MTSEPEAMREFLHDKLQLPHTDVGEGWLTFDLPEAHLGVHPTEDWGGAPSGTHDLPFYCDDIHADRGYGLVTHVTMPGGVRVPLYEPRYLKKAEPRKKAAPKRKKNR